MGGEPAFAGVGAGQLLQPLLPDAAVAIAELAIGVAAGQGPLSGPVALPQGGHQVGFVISHQPDGPAGAHQAPGQLHGAADLGAAVDHITAKHNFVAGWQTSYQPLQRVGTAVDVPDHPVVAGT